jgi:hypothetical protein
MWEVFIIILVAVGIFSLVFNIWNKKNPVKPSRSSSNKPASTAEEWDKAIEGNKRKWQR